MLVQIYVCGTNNNHLRLISRRNGDSALSLMMIVMVLRGTQE